MGVIDDAHLSATKNDLITSLVQRELIDAAVLGPTVRDVSKFAVKGAKTIEFPKAGSFTVEDRATGVQAALAEITYGTDTLTLGFMATVSWVVDPQDDIESAVNTEADLAGRAARAHGKYVDTKIIAQLEIVGVATTTAGAISKAIILEMRKALLDRQADKRNLWLAIDTDSEAALLAISEFVEADKYGSSAIPTGELGKLFGVRVMMSTQVGASTYYMYEPDGLNIGFQKGLAMDERKAPEYGTGAKLKTMDQKFGTSGGMINQQGVGALESALVQKDNN